MTAPTVPDDADGIRQAEAVLRGGGIVGLPTDTVYGIAVALDAADGIERLFAVKDRPPDRAIMVLVDSLEQVADLVTIPAEARVLAAAFWPGGLTLVFPLLPDARGFLPPGLSAGSPTLGVRVPDHATPRALARLVGPIPTTSANRHGEPPALDGDAVRIALGDRLDLILDGGPVHGGLSSTVVTCAEGPPRVLRVGAIPPRLLAAVLDDAGLAHALGDS